MAHEENASNLAGPLRASQPEWTAPPSDPWVPMVAFGLFAIGFFVGRYFLKHISVAETLDDVALYEVWADLFGALMGFALASCVYFFVWLKGLRQLCDRIPVWKAAGVVALILVVVFAFLVHISDSAPVDLNQQLGKQARWLTFAAAAAQAPGLIGFLALQFVATDDATWLEPATCQLRLVMRLRAELRRLLTTFGAFLTLLVITTGVRRKTLLASQETLDIPAETVLVYGLLFAVILGLFYLSASGAIDRRAESLLDAYAPLPDPADAALSDAVKRRTDLASLTGGGGSWGTFQTTVVIAAPLLTGLIGSATGK